MKPQGYIPASASPSAREGADLHIRNVVKVAALLAGTLVTSILILVLFFRHMEKLYPNRTSEAAPVVTESELPPFPRLQTNPLHDLQAVRAVEDSHLDRYVWIDREHGVAQIPIERAMILWTKSYSAHSDCPCSAAPTVIQTPSRALSGPPSCKCDNKKQQEAPHAP